VFGPSPVADAAMPFSRFRQSLEALRSLWPQSAARLVRKGARLRERGKLDEALAALDEAIDLDSKMAEAYAHRCACYCDLDEYAKAIEDANQAITLAPEKANAYLWRADAAHRLGQNESAIADLNKAQQFDPKDTWIYYKRGTARCAAEDYPAALADVDRFLEEHPEEAYGYETRASARRGLGELDSALAAIDEAVRRDPKNGRFHFFRAGLLSELDRPEEAFGEYEAALAQDCELADDLRNVAIVRQKWLGGSIARKRGDYREAIDQYGTALDILEQSDDFEESAHRLARLYRDRGIAWHSLGEYQHALRDLDEVVRLKPEDENSLYFRAELLLLCDRTEEASATYESAQEIDPEPEEGWDEKTIAHRNWLAGAIALKQGDLREAIEQFDAALEADPTIARVYNDRGEAWYQMGEYERALSDFDKAVTLAPENSVHYINRANALMGLRRYADGKRDLVEARRRGPDCARSYRYLAWYMATCPEPEFRNGRQAVAMAHKAIELAGGHPTRRLCATLAAACAENGDFDEAIRWQTEVLATVPDEDRFECEAILEKYRAGIPHRMPESEDWES
jgi:tetratricopeptide (TPR) repeat protein